MGKQRGKSTCGKRQKRRFSMPEELHHDDAARVIFEDQQSRVIELSPTMQDLLEYQLDLFRKKFGREPGPNDPVFFDPKADEPQPLPEESFTDAMAEAAHEAGISEAKIYAIQMTGMIIVDGMNDHIFSEEDKAEWQAAIEEFETMS